MHAGMTIVISTAAKPGELRNFFWHCHVAAKLIDELPVNPATRAHVGHAIRKATVCWDGRDGVGFASTAALKEQRVAGVHWDRCGLIREHVIPVAVVTRLLRTALEATRGCESPSLQLSADDHAGFPSDVIAQFKDNPRAWQVARLVRQWTLQAWITPNDEERLRDHDKNGCNLTQSMPPYWTPEQSRFARYDHCGLRLEPIR